MKKKILVLATICCLLVSLIVPSTASAAQNVQISFQGFGGDMLVHDPSDGGDYVTGGMGRGGYVPGIAFKDQEANYGMTFEDPTWKGDVFEGWIKYQFEEDENGEFISRHRLSADDEFYTTEEILNQPVDDFNVEYFAKWANLPISEYDRELEEIDSAAEPAFINVSIGLGGIGDTAVGYITLADGTEFMLDYQTWLERECETGRTIKEAMGINKMFEPVIEGDSSGFLGWMISIPGADTDGNPVDLEGPIPTEDMLNYVIPDENPLNPDEPFNLNIEAVWEAGAWGDADPVLFAVSGNGGKLTVRDDMSQSTINTDCYYGEFMSPGPVRNAVPFKIASVEKAGAVLSGWTVYEADAIIFDEREASVGLNFGDPDMEILLYDTYTNDSAIDMNVYISLLFGKVIDSSMSTEELYDLGGNDKSYYAVANWTTGTVQEITVNGQEARLEIATDITAVDSNLKDKFKDAKEIKKALHDATKTVKNFDNDKVKVKYMDITLKVKNADGIWEVVTADNFPKEGISILLPYPEGTDKDDYSFAVAHMITSGVKAGQVEILDVIEEEDGLRVVFTSLSPVAIAYQEEADETVAAPDEDVKEEAKGESAPATGDDMNLMASMLTLLGAATGVTLARKNRKREQ